MKNTEEKTALNNADRNEQIIKICQDYYDNDKSGRAPYEKELILNYPHLFVFGCIMDKQINAKKAWQIPILISEEIEGEDFNSFLSHDKDYYSGLFDKKTYHRFNGTMGQNLYEAICIIHNKYNDDASNIWNDNPSSAELVYRFLEFPGIGEKIATMAANLLQRDYGVKLKDRYSIDISKDVHVKRTMYRLGLLEPIKNHDLQKIKDYKVIYMARSINPEFPGLLDWAFYRVGSKRLCTNTSCAGGECPFNAICKKQGL